MFFRRIAVTNILIVAAVLFGVVYYLQTRQCLGSVACGWIAFTVAMVFLVPGITYSAYQWGKWYERKTTRLARQLERDYHQQVALVELQRERLSVVLRYLADGVLLINDRGEVRLINPAAQRLLHTTSEEAIGHTFATVAYHHKLIDLWQACRLTGVEQEAALEIERRGVFVHAIVTPIQPTDRNSFLVVLQDLTRIRRLETIRRDFISNVSHELLTPIASLGALVETLEDGAMNDPPAAKHFLGRAQVEVDSMSQLVNELLTLSRIESGVTEFHIEPVHISELVLNSVERMREQALRNKIELQLDVSSELPRVKADLKQIRHVVTNIMHNGIKHTDPGGIITLSAHRKGQAEIKVSIEDTGGGIHPDDLPRIFERFYKADRARQRTNMQGTGLGLAIAKHIILAHDGRIWAESKLGKGSRFFFTLPVA
ncbi:MAG: ATP-binding protein [Chloroflexota bacterium]